MRPRGARRRTTPTGFESNANVKLFRALSQLILDVVPGDPGTRRVPPGQHLGPAHRHWRRAKIGRRFRLFFRYDSKAKVIVYAWVNDEQTLRSSGSKSDPVFVFEKMLGRGNPQRLACADTGKQAGLEQTGIGIAQ
ncbi:type II toxin-antitoxin system YhaV family toxin [Pseudomonas aeruginosa]|uniref:type II toxin-antitoxin system YhaV family toxin n=1 Tax=Pseudomonas aeruginosa TaxID=287 RepID=UPI003D15EB2A